jgi:SAM-dependent methyltransferase
VSTELRATDKSGVAASRREMRETMFLSQDGVVLCATLRGLDRLGILAPSLEEERSLADLCPELTSAGFGALRVALHCLACTGWLEGGPTLDPATTVARWTPTGLFAARSHRHYVQLGDLLAGFAGTAGDAWTRPWPAAQIERFQALVEPACERWGLGDDIPPNTSKAIRAHLNAGLTVPTMLWLHETDRLGEARPVLPEDGTGKGMARLLTALDWTSGVGGKWTAPGLHARAFALNFGGVATYLPLLARLPELFRGELDVKPPAEEDGEWHVHRELNLRISAAAHRRYFVDSDEIVIELFDREPLECQPRFVADMGCGDGSWLIHLHRLIGERTRRGRSERLDPPLMVGIDLDRGALEQARRNLEATGVPALLIEGDVTDPDRLKADLAEHGLAIEDGLHIRAFIDHERGYVGGEPAIEAPGFSHGVYIGAAGEPLAAADVERDLIAHMARWRRHAGKHGMIVLEAHCVAPAVAARQLGALHSVAFDAHQAYSKQYPVDHAAFVRCCQLAGLQPLPHCERRYPSNRPFVSIGLNRLVVAEEEPLPAMGAAPRPDGWRPPADTDLEDGEALHEILFVDGDVRYPAAWGSGATGFVVAGTLAAIEARLRDADEGDTIRVLDYGAGTGTATIELLKACRERGYEERLARLGASLEIHLVDLPSSWFAQGFELLSGCEWVRFHSLRNEDGGFRVLPKALGGLTMDAAMANMVFHLIPPGARERMVDGLADALTPGGRLLWSAPDLGPPGPYAVLLHDPNRALRERWLELLGAGEDGLSPTLRKAIRRAREHLDEDALRHAQERADRRILPRPFASEMTETLERRFEGEVELRAYEMLDEDVVRGLLVPSNQAEYLAEIDDRKLREAVIRELMLDDVLPRMKDGAVGTGLGINLHWTLGNFSKLP